MASFVALVIGVMEKLEVAEKERKFLEENMEIVFQLGSVEGLGLEGYRVGNDDNNC